MSEFHIIIPARLGSSRLARKALLPIDGQPMVVRVAQRVSVCGAASVVVATDALEIQNVCVAAGIRTVMTRPDHVSGTDRIAEAAAQLQLSPQAVLVNVQGDEPLIEPELVRAVAALAQQAPVATAASVITQVSDAFNPNIVKVVLDQQQHALYFSRAPIPWDRTNFKSLTAGLGGLDSLSEPMYRHWGIYAFRHQALQQFVASAPARLEQIEMLEQLRFLALGVPIKVYLSPNAGVIGVDTEEDWHAVNAYIKEHPQQWPRSA